MAVAARTLAQRIPADRRASIVRALRWAAPIAYVVALATHIATSGLSIARDEMFLWVALALLAGSITRPRRFFVGIVLEWLPFAAILFAYDLLRGYADGLLFSPRLDLQLHGDQLLFGGTAPTVWLQHHLWGGPAHVRWYDYASWGVYMTHFLATLVLAGSLWLFAHDRFRRYVAMVATLAVVGFATYVLYPAVPPWMAANQGHLPPVDRIIGFAWPHIQIFSFDTLFQTGSQYANDVAAMPSLHAAYSLLITLYLWGSTRRVWVRVLLAAYPLAMAFALVYTAEHFFTDILVGWLYAIAAFMAVNEVAGAWAERRARRPARLR
jgi:membrane-associated phospholipid phosphatase